MVKRMEFDPTRPLGEERRARSRAPLVIPEDVEEVKKTPNTVPSFIRERVAASPHGSITVYLSTVLRTVTGVTDDGYLICRELDWNPHRTEHVPKTVLIPYFGHELKFEE
jgi:hypothetical protein